MARDTGHLSNLEFGIYNRLLDWYYANEKPIPADRALKLARGNPKETQSVLEEYFKPTPEGWRHSYADKEIAKYRAKAERNREVGKTGGRPAKTIPCDSGNPEITQMVIIPNPEITLATNPLIHKSTKEQDQELMSPKATKPKTNGTRLPDDWYPSDDLETWARSERPSVNLKTEIEKFRDFWHAKAGANARKVNWDKTFRNWIRNAREPQNGNHTTPNRKLSLVEQSEQAIRQRIERESENTLITIPARPDIHTHGEPLWPRMDE